MKLSKIQLGLTKACLTAGSLALISASSLAIAQENDSNDNEAMVEEIVITGVRGSILNNLNQKRDAGSFVDAISAEEMGKFPDLNLSESLQRVPGVTLTRNDFGDGSSINLRGLGPTYSRVEINGLTGPVNDARGGGFARVSADLLALIAGWDQRGLALDPVYTAKLMWALQRETAEEEAEETAMQPRRLMVHSGGLQGRRGVKALA